MNTLGILGIVLAFALLMFLIMKNLNLYLTVFICVAVVIILNGLSPYETFKETYMTGFVGFCCSWQVRYWRNSWISPTRRGV